MRTRQKRAQECSVASEQAFVFYGEALGFIANPIICKEVDRTWRVKALLHSFSTYMIQVLFRSNN